ncbi:hypothetical protein PG995_002970 [Apiospora arundinis]
MRATTVFWGLISSRQAGLSQCDFTFPNGGACSVSLMPKLGYKNGPSSPVQDGARKRSSSLFGRPRSDPSPLVAGFAAGSDVQASSSNLPYRSLATFQDRSRGQRSPDRASYRISVLLCRIGISTMIVTGRTSSSLRWLMWNYPREPNINHFRIVLKADLRAPRYAGQIALASPPFIGLQVSRLESREQIVGPYRNNELFTCFMLPASQFLRTRRADLLENSFFLRVCSAATPSSPQ